MILFSILEIYYGHKRHKKSKNVAKKINIKKIVLKKIKQFLIMNMYINKCTAPTLADLTIKYY